MLLLLLLAGVASASENPANERGAYLVRAGNCVGCHTRKGGAAFSGGVAFETRFGTIYSTNITPDKETGIGNWSVRDLRRAMHEGIGADGARLFPAFPYTSFTKVSDEDVDAIYSYLRTLKPVRYSPPENGLLFSQRWAMRFWNALYFKPGRFVPVASESAEWNRGAYLVEGLGHCNECHGPRDLLMGPDRSNAYTGGIMWDHPVGGGKSRVWSAVNLTSSDRGLAAWSVDELAAYLKKGVSRRAGTFGPMDDVILNSTSHLTPQDARAMAVYVKALPPNDKEELLEPAQPTQTGAQLYEEHCEECHMSSGRGGIFSGPPLAKSAIVQADHPASLINVGLHGPQAPNSVSFGAWQTMKPFSKALSDDDVAEIANFLRGSWGNKGSRVSAEEVAVQR